MGRLNWNGNRQPKLSYKSEGLERLFLQLIKGKLTNPDKFLRLSYLKILNFSYLLPLLEFQKKFSPINISFEILVPSTLQRGGGGGEDYVKPAHKKSADFINWSL